MYRGRCGRNCPGPGHSIGAESASGLLDDDRLDAEYVSALHVQNEALGYWEIGDTVTFLDEPLQYVKGVSSRGSVDSKSIQYYNKYENFELAISLNVRGAALT